VKRRLLWSALVFLAAVCGACRTYPKWNEPLNAYRPSEGYRLENVAPGDNSDSLFVILTFSGGGTRAAALAFGVLEELRDTTIEWEGRQCRLLDEVDIISSVSGGSLTAAYFGLYGERVFTDFLEEVLYRDVQREFIRYLVRLGNSARVASPFFGRTDLLAEQLNQRFFEGMTFADLQARGRPFIIINATDLSLGLPFTFTQAQFNLISSDLGTYPVGNAVAASMAFPGLLTPMVIRSYAAEVDVPLPGWVEETLGGGPAGTLHYRYAEALASYRAPERKFIHLVDGGVADNLGLLPVIQSFRGDYGDWGLLPLLETGRVKRMIIIAVNAIQGLEWTLDEYAETAGLLAVLDFVTAIPIGNFAQVELEYLRLLIKERTENQRVRAWLSESNPGAEVPPGLLGQAAPPVEYSFAEVTFSRIADPEARGFFYEIPTALELPAETVDRLRQAGRDLLRADPEYRRLIEALGASSTFGAGMGYPADQPAAGSGALPEQP
jgi:NTE family protein